MRRTGTTILMMIFLLAISGTTFAHHGTNISYDTTKEVILTGTVTGFQWANPHAQLFF